MIETKTFTNNISQSSSELLLYYDPDIECKAFIIYIHGGGLFYGEKTDLPDFHINSMIKAGFRIIAIDYPLAPNTKIDLILDDVNSSINYIIENKKALGLDNLSYFLWGRSAGAYLGLLTLSKTKLDEKPLGLISYYGYGFFDNDWDKLPSKYYNTFPKINENTLGFDEKETLTSASLEERYHLYVYARQSGKWTRMLFDGREKYFYENFSLRNTNKLSVPIFATHAINDTDVPFFELNKIANLSDSTIYIAPVDLHDYDRDTTSVFTKKLIDKTIEFLDSHLN
jgi:acetyl esterase